MANMIRPHQRHDDVVVLLTLEAVGRGDLVRLAEERVPGAALPHDVADQRLLPVVGGQDGDLVGGVAQQPHVHEEGNAVLSLPEVLVVVGLRRRLPNTVEVLHIDELVVVREAGVRHLVLRVCEDLGQVAEVLVAPAVEVGDLRAGAALQVQVDGGRAEAHEARVQRLVQVPVLLEGAVLDHGRQLVMVADEHHALQAARAALRILQHHGDEGLDLQDLGRLLHDEVVVLEVEADQRRPGQGCVRARHGDDARVRRDQVVAAVVAVAEELEGVALLDLLEHVLEVAEATLRHLQVRLVARARKERLRGVREEGREREDQGHHRRLVRLQLLLGTGDRLLHLLGMGLHIDRPSLALLRLLLLERDLLVIATVVDSSVLAPALLVGLAEGLGNAGAVLAGDGELLLELLPAVLDVVEEEVLGVLAGVRGVLAGDVEGGGEALHLGQEIQAALQHVVHASPLGEVLLGVQLLDAAAQTQEVPLGDVQCNDLLEEVVECLIRVRDEHDLLVREVVEEQVDHLDRGVRLARAGRSNDHREPGVDAGADRLDLHWREAHLVLTRLALGVGAHVGQLVGSRQHVLRRTLSGLSLSGVLELQAEGSLKIVGDLDVLSVGEGLQDVVLVDERVTEVNLVQLGRQLPVDRRARVAVAEEEVVQPVGHDRVLAAHQAADRVEDGLEVVLLRLAAHHAVQRRVDVAHLALGHGLQISVVLRGVQEHPDHAVVADGRLPLGGVGLVDDVPLLVKQLRDLRAAQRLDAEGARELRDGEVLELALVGHVRRLDADEEDHVVLSELVPLIPDVLLHASEADLDLGAHLRRHRLPDLRALHVHDLDAHERHHHARPAVELRHAIVVHRGLHAGDRILEVPADLVGGLQAEEVEVPEEVVVDGQELEVQLRQRQGIVAGVVLLRHQVRVPDQLLRGHERELLDVVLLHDRALQSAHEDLRQELAQARLLRGNDLLLPLLLRAVVRRLLLLLGLRLLNLGEGDLDLLLHLGEGGVLGDVQIADLGAQDLQGVQRQRPQLRSHGQARVQRRHVRDRDLLHGLVVRELREADALQQLQALVVEIGDVAPRQRGAGRVVNLEVFVVLQDLQQLIDEPGLGQGRDLGVAAAHGQVLVHEQRPEEAAGRELVKQVDHQLDGALEEGELHRCQGGLVAVLLERRQELVQKLRHEVALVPCEVGLRIRVLFLDLLPEGRELLVRLKELVAVQLIEVEPGLQAGELQGALADEVLLQALEAVDEELDHVRPFPEVELRGLPEAEHALEVAREHLFPQRDGVPSGDAAVANLLVDQEGDGHEVTRGRLLAIEEGPEVPLQVGVEL
mmetsp:Transcript_144/g.310  ORF Transcript_144/g.310 Transcript_144/m.310 type:complete len:1317 (+) Transcript_144:450-4400(+)